MMDWNSIDSEHWVFVAMLFGLAELGLQIGLFAACPFRAIGDEVEYIERGRAGRPFSPVPFFRVPLLPFLAWFGGRIGHPTVFLRLISIAFSASAMAATAGAATRLGGAGIGTILCLGLFVIPERVVLGSRIWPDVALAATTSAMVLILSLTPTVQDLDRSAMVLGFLVSLAVLTRLDALVLVPAIGAVWAMVSPDFTLTQAGWLVGLPIISFGAWWLVAVGILGQRWPDTTWIFNLGVAAQEARAQDGGDPVTIDDLIGRLQTEMRHSRTDDRFRAHRNRMSIPWTGFLSSAAARLRAMLGPDTFVQGKILAEAKWERGSITQSVLSALFRASVPSVIALSFGMFILQPSRVGWMAIPSLSLMIPAVLIHARTRYRLPLIYGLFPVLAGSVCLTLVKPQPTQTGFVIRFVLIALVLWLVLARQPRRMERR